MNPNQSPATEPEMNAAAVSSAGGQAVFTECCGVPMEAGQRFCRKCGYEARLTYSATPDALAALALPVSANATGAA